MARYISETWGKPQTGRFVLLAEPAVKVTRVDGSAESLDYPKGFRRVELLAAWPLIWTCIRPEHARHLPTLLAADRCDETPSRFRLSLAAQQAETVLWYGPILSSSRAAAVARIRELGREIQWKAADDPRLERRFVEWDAIGALPILPSFPKNAARAPWPYRWPFTKTRAWWDTSPRRLPRYEFRANEVRTAYGIVPRGEFAAIAPSSPAFVAGSSAAESVYATFPVIQQWGPIL